MLVIYRAQNFALQLCADVTSTIHNLSMNLVLSEIPKIALLCSGLAVADTVRSLWSHEQLSTRPYKNEDGEATEKSEAKAARLGTVTYTIFTFGPAVGLSNSILNARSSCAQTETWLALSNLLSWAGPVLWVSDSVVIRLKQTSQGFCAENI